MKDFFSVPSDIYPVGRLDYDSEGLLLLTNDKSINHRLLDPQFEHEREYWVQVEGSIEDNVLRQLETGVTINVDGQSYKTKASGAILFVQPPSVPERIPPIRVRKNIPTTWIRLILTEGKNRQVRKMTAAVGFPTLRLIRARIQGIALEDLAPGQMRELSRDELYPKLFSGKQSR